MTANHDKSNSFVSSHFLHSYVTRGSYCGSVANLMTAGLAVEFKQPWYTPLSTTPLTTGMAVGGIGSAYTVTPASTTPALHCIPGVQIRGSHNNDVKLANFHFAERVQPTTAEQMQFRLNTLADFTVWNQFYPLVNEQGTPLFNPSEDGDELTIQKVQQAVLQTNLWSVNAQALERWHIEWSPATQSYLEAGNTQDVLFNRLWLLDFFNGALADANTVCTSLTADCEAEQWSGQPAYPAQKMTYNGLYPVSQTVYQGEHSLQLTRYQYSLILPNEERLCSLPVSFTRFVVHNPSAKATEFTLLQAQENLCGFQAVKDRPGVQDASFVIVRTARNQENSLCSATLNDGRQVCSVQMANSRPIADADFKGTMAISVVQESGLQISAKPAYYMSAEDKVIDGALLTGRLNTSFNKGVYSGREIIGGALVVSGVLQPGETKEVVFATTLDFAQIDMPGIRSVKKYVGYFSEAATRLQDMIVYGFEHEAEACRRYEEAAERMLPEVSIRDIYGCDANPKQPGHGLEAAEYRTLALNTLSFLAEATVWDDADRFLVRECADYPFFNSLDVYFYGSFSLLKLLPRLDGQVMRRFSDAVLLSSEGVRRHHEYTSHPHADLPEERLEGRRHVKGAVIHDLGSPFDARPDAYDWHNVKEWKDLAPKFMLMVWRHYRITDDKRVVDYCWEAVEQSMAYLENLVEPGQLFPLTHGTDDTFDNLKSHGISVYSGSLWVAGMRAYAQLAAVMGNFETREKYLEKAQQAQTLFQDVLWDETQGYYHFYVTPITLGDFAPNAHAQRATALKSLGLICAEDPMDQMKAINKWLNSQDETVLAQIQPELEQKIAQAWSTYITKEEAMPLNRSRRQQRSYKKLALYCLGEQYWTEQFIEKLDLDSDEVFADQLLADSYCRMLGLRPICPNEVRSTALQTILTACYRTNSPNIGAANLVRKDGSPMEWHNFQAHDVWIGVQYSLATALLQSKMIIEARDLLASMYRNLYIEARIPFAAPEGFNGTCRFELQDAQKLGASNPATIIQALTEQQALLEDGRIHPNLPRTFENFSKKYETILQQFRTQNVDSLQLFNALHATALKYTAGRYFRPGMIFSLTHA